MKILINYLANVLAVLLLPAVLLVIGLIYLIDMIDGGNRRA